MRMVLNERNWSKMSKIFRQCVHNALEWDIRVVREVPAVE